MVITGVGVSGSNMERTTYCRPCGFDRFMKGERKIKSKSIDISKMRPLTPEEQEEFKRLQKKLDDHRKQVEEARKRDPYGIGQPFANPWGEKTKVLTRKEQKRYNELWDCQFPKIKVEYEPYTTKDLIRDGGILM